MEPRLAPLATLAIEHVDGSNPAAFKLTRLSDNKSLPHVTLPSPYEFPVPNHPHSLMHELRWYLEEFLDYPFPPETTHAEHVLDSLKSWGTQAKPPARKSHLPQEVTQHRDPYGFIGRDGPGLEMERALHRKAPCILVQGLGGVHGWTATSLEAGNTVAVSGYRAKSGAYYMRITKLKSSNGTELKSFSGN